MHGAGRERRVFQHPVKGLYLRGTLKVLEQERVDLATVDIVMPPGASLDSETTGQVTGYFLCEQIVKRYPKLDLVCLSVVNDPDLIGRIQYLVYASCGKVRHPFVLF